MHPVAGPISARWRAEIVEQGLQEVEPTCDSLRDREAALLPRVVLLQSEARDRKESGYGI